MSLRQLERQTLEFASDRLEENLPTLASLVVSIRSTRRLVATLQPGSTQEPRESCCANGIPIIGSLGLIGPEREVVDSPAQVLQFASRTP